MRRVAQALDTGAASLYVYVSDRDELYDLLFDAAIGTIETEPTDPARWREQLRALAHRMVTMMSDEFPGIAKLAMARIPTGDNALRVTESMLSLLKAGGASDQAAAYAADLVSMYVTAIAYENEPVPAAPPRPRLRAARGRARSPSASRRSTPRSTRRWPRSARR